MKASTTLYRSAVRVAVGVLIILSVPLVAMQFTDELVWSLADFVVVGVLLTAIGITIELAVRRTGGLATAMGIAAVAIAAAYLGEVDDAPGLVLLGILLFISAIALGARSTQRAK